MERKSRTQLFQQIIDEIKARRFVAKAELCKEIADTNLFNKCVDSMEEVGMIKTSYVFSPSGRQRQILEAVNLENSELIIRALAKVLSPSLRELFDVWYGKRHAAVDTRTKEELEKEKKGHSTIDLLSELHSRGRASEYE